MAVTNMWAVKGSVSSVVDYIENPEKTTPRDMQQVMSYITDADTAHKIGVELAQELWGDRFEVVVATHLNTGHYHNHFCLNSVSFRDGYKYHDTKEDIRRMRDVSDAICRRYGLSIEDRPRIDQDRRRNYREWKDQNEGKITLRGKVRADIDAAIQCSRTEREFAATMRDMGYQFILKSETGKDLVHPKLRLPDSDKCVRLDSLGPGYGLGDYRMRIIRNTVIESPYANLDSIPAPEKVKRYTDRLSRAGFRVTITYHCLQLRSCAKRRKYREYSPQLIEEIRKFKRFCQLQSCCRKYMLDTPEQVDALKEALRKRISDIAKARDEDRKQQRYWERKGVPAYANLYRLAAQEKTKQMRPLYQEIRICEEIVQAEPGIRAMTIGLVQQRVNEENRRQLRNDLGKTQRKSSGRSR